MAEGNSSGWVGQLVGAVVLALVAGGSSPWWWSELKRSWQPDAPAAAATAPVATTRAVSAASATNREASVAARPAAASAAVERASAQPSTLEPNPEAYRAVQRIYERTKGVTDCAALADSVKNLERYARGQRPVPDQFRQTVLYPKPMAQPTIGDLTIDRIARIKLASPSCFP